MDLRTMSGMPKRQDSGPISVFTFSWSLSLFRSRYPTSLSTVLTSTSPSLRRPSPRRSSQNTKRRLPEDSLPK